MYNISTYYIIKVEGMKSVDKTITMPDNYRKKYTSNVQCTQFHII